MTWAVRGTADGNGSGTTTVIDVSGIGIQDGDWVIVGFIDDEQSLTVTIDDSGWTEVAVFIANGSGCKGWHKIAATEPSSYTVTQSITVSESRARCLVLYDDAAGALTLDDADAVGSLSDVGNLDGPTIDTANNGHVVDFMFTDGTFGGYTTPPTGTQVGTVLGTLCQLDTYRQNVSAGTHQNSMDPVTPDGLGILSCSAHFAAAGGPRRYDIYMGTA